jgi:hypothetical protein
MSYQSEHKRLKPVLNMARLLDIATNPEKKAVFEAGSAGFQVWCTPEDHPKGWGEVSMVSGIFSKPCEFVGGVHWKWEGERIVALAIETAAYALADQRPESYTNLHEPLRGDNRRMIYNRDEDIAWLQEKVTWLFREAGIDMPPFEYEPAPLLSMGPYRLAHYTGKGGEYVVVVSPSLDLEEFCKAGYELANEMNIGDAGDFPADIILRPEYGFPEPDLEPDEGPLVEQFENASRMGEDDWLEAAFEDRISGYGEE